MNTTQEKSKTVEVAVAPYELAPEISNKIVEAFEALAEEAGSYRERAAAISIESVDDIEAMAEAREIRLAIKKTRTTAEKQRKDLKRSALDYGKAVDDCYKVIDALARPVEEELLEKEQFVERQEQARIEALHTVRTEALAPFLATVPEANRPDVAVLGDAEWEELLAECTQKHEDALEGQRLVAEAKAKREAEEAAAAARAKQEEEARAKAEAEERARVAAEQEAARAAAEAKAAEAERALAEERAKAEKARLEAEAKADAEMKAAEEARRAEREEAARKLAAIEAERAKEAKARAEAEAAAAAAREAEQREEAILASPAYARGWNDCIEAMLATEEIITNSWLELQRKGVKP